MDIIDSIPYALGSLGLSGVSVTFPVANRQGEEHQGPCPSLSCWTCHTVCIHLFLFPAPIHYSNLSHLYPILGDFSHSQTLLWNMLMCLMMGCSRMPRWMLCDVCYMSHILYYFYVLFLYFCVSTCIYMFCVHVRLYVCVEVKVQSQYVIHLVF